MSEEQDDWRVICNDEGMNAKDIYVEDSMGQRESLHNIIWMLLSDMHDITAALSAPEVTKH